MASDDELLSRYLRGLNEAPAIQVPPGRPGDPQVAALYQYLQARTEWLSGRLILDYGCGYGIVPTAINEVWSGNGAGDLPLYVGVDFQSVLDAFELPARLRATGRKVTIDAFFTDELPNLTPSAAAVVVRNVFHELDISATGELLAAIASHVHPPTDIYIQDMTVVNPMERLNPGWNADILVDLLAELGFAHLPPVKLTSHSGTPWFVVMARASHNAVDSSRAAAATGRARNRQMAINCDRLNALKKPDHDSAYEFTTLSMETSAIASQLQKHGYGEHSSGRTMPRIGIPLLDIGVPYAEVVPAPTAESTAIAAVVSSKNSMDFPRLLDHTERFAYFAGYSVRSLFKGPETLTAIEALIGRGGQLRILLCDPSSVAVAARATAPVYADDARLRGDINKSIEHFGDLRKRIEAHFGDAAARFELRLTAQLPPCAYFIVDDLCFTSLYTMGLSGGSGPTVVFQPGRAQVSYYDILLSDFVLAWDGALQPVVDA